MIRGRLGFRIDAHGLSRHRHARLRHLQDLVECRDLVEPVIRLRSSGEGLYRAQRLQLRHGEIRYPPVHPAFVFRIGGAPLAVREFRLGGDVRRRRKVSVVPHRQLAVLAEHKVRLDAVRPVIQGALESFKRMLGQGAGRPAVPDQQRLCPPQRRVHPAAVRSAARGSGRRAAPCQCKRRGNRQSREKSQTCHSGTLLKPCPPVEGLV